MIILSARWVVVACNYSIFSLLAFIAGCYIGVTVVEAQVEELVFGERFLHWLDPVIAVAHMGYFAVCCKILALINERDRVK